jgi:hypothetical protein
MLENLADGVRKFSLILIGVGLLVAFWTEAFSDIKIGRDGKPKPPMRVQRLQYLAVIGAGVPGSIWMLSRAANGKPPSWD